MKRTLLIVGFALLLGMPASLAEAHTLPSVPCLDGAEPDACASPLDSRCGPPFPCCYVDPATGTVVCCFQVGERVVCVAAECTIDPVTGWVTCCYVDPVTGRPVCVILLGRNEIPAPVDDLLP